MAVQTNYGQITDNGGDAGGRIGNGYNETVRPLKAGGGAQEVATVVVDTAANSTAYTYSVSGESITITSDGSATKIEIAAALAEAHNVNATAAAASYAVSDGVDTVTITARENNNALSASDSDGNLTTTTTTSASAGTDIPFGCGVVAAAFDECGLPGAGTAQVDTLTPVDVHLATYTVNIQGDFDQDGTVQLYSASYIADAATTVAEITAGLTAAINLSMPANSVLAADGTTVVTLTSENPGVGFSSDGDGDIILAVIAVVTTTANASASTTFAGVALKTQLAEGSSTTALWGADQVVDVLSDGECYVLLDSGITPAVGDPVYMRGVAGAGEQLGAFTNTPDGDDSILLSNCRWSRAATTGLDGSTEIAGLIVRAH